MDSKRLKVKVTVSVQIAFLLFYVACNSENISALTLKTKH